MILLCWYKRYSICLISFFNLHELFPAFITLEVSLAIYLELEFLILFLLLMTCQINLHHLLWSSLFYSFCNISCDGKCIDDNPGLSFSIYLSKKFNWLLWTIEAFSMTSSISSSYPAKYSLFNSLISLLNSLSILCISSVSVTSVNIQIFLMLQLFLTSLFRIKHVCQLKTHIY